MIKCKAPRTLICEGYIPWYHPENIEQMEWRLFPARFPFSYIGWVTATEPIANTYICYLLIVWPKACVLFSGTPICHQHPSPPAGVWGGLVCTLVNSCQSDTVLVVKFSCEWVPARGPPNFWGSWGVITHHHHGISFGMGTCKSPSRLLFSTSSKH